MNVSRKTIGLLLLALAALSLRIWVVLALTTDHAGPVTYEHGRIAENLLAGQGFSIEFLGTDGPTSQQAPLYPAFVAIIYACFGIGTPASILAIQLIQCLAGTALVLAIAWLGWSLFADRPCIGWVAGIGAAIYPTHLYMVTHVQVAVWAALLLTLLLAVVVSPRWRGTTAGAILAGCVAGTLLLVEPILALALPICALAFWLADGYGSRQSRFRLAPIGRIALMALVAAAIIGPWTIRNRTVHGEFVFVKSTFGYAFWQGNNRASWGTDKLPNAAAESLRLEHNGSWRDMDRALWEARHETAYIDDVLLRPTGYREFAGLSEPARSRLLGRRAVAFIQNNPTAYARLCLNRLRYFLLFDETNPKAANRIYRASTVVWLVLGLIGLIVSFSRWRTLWPTYAIFAAVTLFHALVITSVRFRIPIEPLAFVWAAAAVGPLLVRLVLRTEVRIYQPGEHPHDPFRAADARPASQHPSRKPRRAA